MVKIATSQCGCGKVQFDIKVTTELVTSPVVGCQCIDCIGFVESVEQARKTATVHHHKMISGGREQQPSFVEPEKYTLLRHIYKSDLVAIRGSEHLGRLCIGPNILRYYSKCCGTPMAFLFTDQKSFLPFIGLWERNFVPYQGPETIANAEPLIPHLVPNVIVWHKQQPPGATALPERVPVGDVAPLSLTLTFAARILYGVPAGKGTYMTSPSLLELGETPIPSGLDSVKLNE